MVAWPDVLSWYGAPAAPGEPVRLDVVESRHLVQVLRRAPGDAVALSDGAGHWLLGRLTDASARGATVLVESVVPAPTEPHRPLVLAVPLLRPARTEWLLEKATELGVTRFVPLRTARTRPGGARTARWGRIVRAAAMQCLRSTPPELDDVTDLNDWISSLDPSLARVAARPGGAGTVRAPQGAALAVGPEGDFDDAEWAILEGNGFEAVDLGPRRLRSETAALALLARVGRDPGNR